MNKNPSISTGSHSAYMRALLAGLIGISGPSIAMRSHHSEPSEAQKRRNEKWLAGAEERVLVAREIAAWNKNVKRRNQRFVARQLARGRSAA